MSQSISDFAIVLSRTDYGEKDRILTIITPEHGKLRAIAKGVRSAKSRLAGGIELFAENKLNLVRGRSELYTITSSRMHRYFGDISKDIDKSMYVYDCLKTVNKLSPDHAGGEYYPALLKLLEALSAGKVPAEQIKIWYALKLLDSLGSTPNFKTDGEGKDLRENSAYQYDFDKHCFFAKPGGPYGADHIKLFRHLSSSPKPVEVKGLDDSLVSSSWHLINTVLTSQI